MPARFSLSRTDQCAAQKQSISVALLDQAAMEQAARLLQALSQVENHERCVSAQWLQGHAQQQAHNLFLFGALAPRSEDELAPRCVGILALQRLTGAQLFAENDGSNGQAFYYISALYVAPAWRAQGLGARLVEQALIWVSQQQGLGLCAISRAQNAGAQRFYARTGFQRHDQLRLFVLDQPFDAAHTQVGLGGEKGLELTKGYDLATGAREYWVNFAQALGAADAQFQALCSLKASQPSCDILGFLHSQRNAALIALMEEQADKARVFHDLQIFYRPSER